MMDEFFSRTAALYGEDSIGRFKNARVAVFGLGGVGGYAVEALARAGIGHLDLVDHDTIELSNLNRQLFALRSNLGKSKVDVAASRIADINPACDVVKHNVFFLPENADSFDFSRYDYVIDAVDTVAAKVTLAQQAQAADTPIICAMGTAGKTDPSKLSVADLYDTHECALAKVMRTECRKRGIEHLQVVYSTEKGVGMPASVTMVPATAGLMMAGVILSYIAKSL